MVFGHIAAVDILLESSWCSTCCPIEQILLELSADTAHVYAMGKIE